MSSKPPKIYRSHRVRHVLLRVLLIAAGAFLLLCILAFFGVRKYIAYTDTGKLYLDVPWLEGYLAGKPAEDPLAPELILTYGSESSEQTGRSQIPSVSSEGSEASAEASGEQDPASSDRAGPDGGG